MQKHDANMFVSLIIVHPLFFIHPVLICLFDDFLNFFPSQNCHANVTSKVNITKGAANLPNLRHLCGLKWL